MLLRGVLSLSCPKFTKIYLFCPYRTHALPFQNIPWCFTIYKIEIVFQKTYRKPNRLHYKLVSYALISGKKNKLLIDQNMDKLVLSKVKRYQELTT